MIHEELGGQLLTLAGMIKNAFIPATFRRSSRGIAAILLEIFCSALISCSGAPVISAEPRSAAYSRYRESVRIRTQLMAYTTIDTTSTKSHTGNWLSPPRRP